MNILFGMFLVLGILSLLYYVIITAYAGMGTAFAWFWICASVAFLVLGFLIRYLLPHRIKIPAAWRNLLIIITAIGFCCFVLLEGTIIFYSQKEAKANVDYLIVLGAQVKGTTVSKSLKKRLDTAMGYLKENPETVAIVSGGQGPGEDISEAEAMQQYLISRGVEKGRIIIEDQSTNTEQNIRYSKLLMKDQEASVAIVTNGFHIFRSISIARKQGVSQVQGLAAPTDRILCLNYYIREAFGVMKDFLYGNL